MLVLDDEFIEASKMTEEELKLEFAIWLFEKEKVSLRKASKMAGLHWLDFSKILSDRNIATVRMTDKDLENEIETVNRLLK
jgi:predicted HTH domain antitoxin